MWARLLVPAAALGLLVAVQLALARWAYRDATGRPGRLPGLDAAMVGMVPLVGLFAYRRSVREGEQGDAAPGDGRSRTRADARERRVADDLIPQLTEQLRAARQEADELRARVAGLQLENDRLLTETARLASENGRLVSENARLRAEPGPTGG